MTLLRRGLAKATRPLRRTVVARTGLIENLIHAVKNELTERLDALAALNKQSLNDAASHASVANLRLDSIDAETKAIRDEVQFLRDAMDARFEAVAPSIRLRHLGEARLNQIDPQASAFLNRAAAHDGPLADAGLWLNNPVVLEWTDGDVRVDAINERIIEQPYALTAIGQLPAKSRVLDVGGGEGTMALSLASLGFAVTVVEPQGYPFTHPNLTVFDGTIEEFARATVPGSFDAILFLSSIEHFGIGHYRNNPVGDDDADIAALAIARELLTAEGILVLTTPYGPASINDLERVYDGPGLERLLDGFTILDLSFGVRSDPTTWSITSDEMSDPPSGGAVAMVTATKPSQ